MCRQGHCIYFGELLCPGVWSLTYSRALLTLWLSPQVSRGQVQRCALPRLCQTSWNPNRRENGCFLQASSRVTRCFYQQQADEGWSPRLHLTPRTQRSWREGPHLKAGQPLEPRLLAPSAVAPTPGPEQSLSMTCAPRRQSFWASQLLRGSHKIGGSALSC